MILTEQVKEHIKKFKQLILGKNSEDNSRLLSEKFSSELSSIPELISYIDNKDVNEKKNNFRRIRYIFTSERIQQRYNTKENI